jgi:hypothetical protein
MSELSDQDSEGIVRQMVMEDPLVWWEGYVKIENKRKELISPQANVLQQRVGDYVRYCVAHGIAMFLIILKPRQKGISTITVGVAQWLQKVFARNLMIVGGLRDQADNLWKIYRRYAETDTFGWGFEGSIQDTTAVWGNGSESAKGTAGGKAPGRSFTIQVLICTEAAYWGHDTDVKNPDAVLTGLLASMPKGADAVNTLKILESTSSGGSGMFYRRWQEAVDLDAFLSGARSPDGSVRIFAGWNEFEDSYIEPESEEEARAILAGLGARNDYERAREREMRVRYKLSAGQLKYWRHILAESGNDPDKRDREYPTTPEDAFRAAQPCRFNLHHLRIMKQEAEQEAHKVLPGVLEQPVAGVPHYTWKVVPEVENANMFIWEHPLPQMRYLISVDNAGGLATGEDKSDTDCHAVTVIRCGYVDARRGGWVRPAVVATIKPKQRVDIDILEEWVWRLHVYYGRCLIAPEANNDRGLIRGLLKRGAHVNQQERHATQVQSHKPSGKYGVWTRGGEGEMTRNWMVEVLARAVREIDTLGEGLFCPFPWILDEMMHFATDPDTGKAEAMDGWHDDWVLAVMIGLSMMSGASVYMPASNAAPLPRDLRIDNVEEITGGEDRV